MSLLTCVCACANLLLTLNAHHRLIQYLKSWDLSILCPCLRAIGTVEQVSGFSFVGLGSIKKSPASSKSLAKEGRSAATTSSAQRGWCLDSRGLYHSTGKSQCFFGFYFGCSGHSYHCKEGLCGAFAPRAVAVGKRQRSLVGMQPKQPFQWKSPRTARKQFNE